MSLTQFIGILAVLGLVFNVVVVYLYFRKEVSEFLGSKSLVEKKSNKELNASTEQTNERVLVGATRENDFDYFPIEKELPESSSEEKSEQDLTDPKKEDNSEKVLNDNDGDNSFSSDDIETELSRLSKAILEGDNNMELDSDVLSQISRSGILKVGIKGAGRTTEKSVMVLENTIVF